MSNQPIKKPETYRRIRTPTLIQMEATECGAVCLGIILGYFGKFIPLEELRIACGISRDGSNAKNVVEAAENYRLKADGYSLDIDDLYSLNLPAILFWKFDHFVVLEGFSKKQVYINDPATGPRTVTYEELDEAFTGVAITFEPTKEFQKGGSPPGLMQGICNRLKMVKYPLIYASLAGLCLIVPNLAFPALTQVFIDQVLVNHNVEWKQGLLIIMAIVIAVKSLLTFLQGQAINRLQTRLSIALGSSTLWHMLHLPMEFYMQRYPGDVAYRLTLNESINKTLADKAIITIISLLFAFSYGLAIVYYDPIIALIAMGAVAANLLLMRYIYRSRSDIYARYQADSARSGSYSIGILENIETIKASGQYSHIFQVWSAYYIKVLNSLQEVGRKDAFLAICSSLLQSFTYFAFIAIAGWRVLDGQLTIGMFAAVQILLFSFIQPVNSLAEVSQNLQFLKVDMARLDDLMRCPIDPAFTKPPLLHPPTKINSLVEVRNLTFGYSHRSPPLFNNLSFTLHPGKCIALVGPSGSGKSTLAKILAGLLYPWQGEVLFDKKTLAEIPHHAFVNSIALVEQDPFLFTGTVRENISFLDSSMPFHTITQAAKEASIHETIINRIDGYELKIEENGANLSGGERQRIEIARALAKNPTLLILDEATNLLDSPTEQSILQNLRHSQRTIVIIAHRLSTIHHCDEIILMDKGAIIAQGTHQELKQRSSHYKRLVELEQKE